MWLQVHHADDVARPSDKCRSARVGELGVIAREQGALRYLTRADLRPGVKWDGY